MKYFSASLSIGHGRSAMGEGNRKRAKREAFFRKHKWCVYCGELAVTTDHCPPRCFFEGRQWPETYEFPACASCNEEARLDELALAVIVRARADFPTDPLEAPNPEWAKLLKGVINNQPTIFAEWMQLSASGRKRAFRRTFGEMGDHLRHEGWGIIHLGPLTQAAINRLMVKLGKALYYRHNNLLFEGVIYTQHINSMAEPDPTSLLERMFELAPSISESQRNKTDLKDQFIYRFNNSIEQGVMYAVVRFSEQFVFQIIALSWEIEKQLAELSRKNGHHLPKEGRNECALKRGVG